MIKNKMSAQEQTKTTIVLDATEFDDFSLCPFRWHAIHELHLAPRDPNVVFERGGLLHDILEKYYLLRRDSGLPQQEIIEECVQHGRAKALDYTSVSVQETSDTLFQFREYARYYENEAWIPLFVEQPFFKQIYEDNELIIAAAGKPDLIFKYAGTNHVAVCDHKRMSRKTEYSMLRNQFMLYALAIGTDTVIANKVGFQKTVKIEERFQRQSFIYHPSLLEEFKQDFIFKAKQLVIHQQEKIYPRERTSCEKYSGCFLQKFCTTRPEAREFLIGGEYRITNRAWDVSARLEETGGAKTNVIT